jgi:membrane fusion protein (multidrug efflux system)
VGLSATVDIDIANQGGSALGTVATPSATYATTVLNQPLQQAQAATDAIVAKNMAN